MFNGWLALTPPSPALHRPHSRSQDHSIVALLTDIVVNTGYFHQQATYPTTLVRPPNSIYRTQSPASDLPRHPCSSRQTFFDETAPGPRTD